MLWTKVGSALEGLKGLDMPSSEQVTSLASFPSAPVLNQIVIRVLVEFTAPLKPPPLKPPPPPLKPPPSGLSRYCLKAHGKQKSHES